MIHSTGFEAIKEQSSETFLSHPSEHRHTKFRRFTCTHDQSDRCVCVKVNSCDKKKAKTGKNLFSTVFLLSLPNVTILLFHNNKLCLSCLREVPLAERSLNLRRCKASSIAVPVDKVKKSQHALLVICRDAFVADSEHDSFLLLKPPNVSLKSPGTLNHDSARVVEPLSRLCSVVKGWLSGKTVCRHFVDRW